MIKKKAASRTRLPLLFQVHYIDVLLLRRYVPFSVFIYIDIKMRLFALSTIDVSKEAR